MTDVIPAVLPKSLAELTRALEHLRGAAAAVQVDVVQDIFTGEEGLPMWDEFDFEFDIYIEPGAFVQRAVELGASSVIVHARHASARQALEVLQQYRSGDYGVRAGLALRPTDTPEVLAQYEDMYDFVQVMGIEREGHQGEPFDPKALELVRSLRATHPELYIQVDGHAAGHEQALAEAGANKLIEGSSIIKSDNPRAALKEAYTRANAQ